VVTHSIWILVLAALVVVGCSTTNEATARAGAQCAQLTDKSEGISEREQQCIRAALIRSNDQITRVAASPVPDSPAVMQTQKLVNEKDQELAKCKANADQEEAELSACQRAEYESKARDERDRSTLFSILMTSLPR
jgi:hypothetical protein